MNPSTDTYRLNEDERMGKEWERKMIVREEERKGREEKKIR